MLTIDRITQLIKNRTFSISFLLTEFELFNFSAVPYPIAIKIFYCLEIKIIFCGSAKKPKTRAKFMMAGLNTTFFVSWFVSNKELII
jgi:hypothetical protein